MSPIALRNVVMGNTIKDYGSTAVHMAWGSCFNVIMGNICITTVSGNEMNGIKGYYGCSNNIVSSNYVAGPGAGAIRFAMGSVYNLISSNRIKDAAIAIQLQSGLPAASGYYQPASVASLDGTSITSNLITGSPIGVSLEASGAAGIASVSMMANDIYTPSTVGVQVTEANSQTVTGINAVETRITGSGTKWTLVRGERHFAYKFANTGLIATPSIGYHRSGCYYLTASTGTGPTTVNTLGNGVLRVIPFEVEREITLTRIGVEVTAIGDTGCTLRPVIYADDGNSFPMTLVLDAGTVAGDSTGVKEITISTTLTPGTYWIGAVVQGVTTTQPTLRGYTSSSGIRAPGNVPLTTGATPSAGLAITFGYSISSVTGSAPSSWGASVAPTSSSAAVFVKVS